MWGLVVAVLAVRAFADGLLAPEPNDLTSSGVSVRIDVNRASLGELQALPGIGPERARAIVLHRVRHGPFRSPTELSQVWGIGPATSAGLLPYATAGSRAGGQMARSR